MANIPPKIKCKHRPLSIVMLLSAMGLVLSGCCGMTNIQAHGGGAGGFASLGALVLGTTAMQRLCETEQEAGQKNEGPPPPDTAHEVQQVPDSLVCSRSY